MRFIDIKTLSREALGFIAVCFSCDELINNIGLSGLHPTLRVPARPEPDGPTARPAGWGSFTQLTGRVWSAAISTPGSRLRCIKMSIVTAQAVNNGPSGNLLIDQISALFRSHHCCCLIDFGWKVCLANNAVCCFAVAAFLHAWKLRCKACPQCLGRL